MHDLLRTYSSFVHYAHPILLAVEKLTDIPYNHVHVVPGPTRRYTSPRRRDHPSMNHAIMIPSPACEMCQARPMNSLDHGRIRPCEKMRSGGTIGIPV